MGNDTINTLHSKDVESDTCIGNIFQSNYLNRFIYHDEFFIVRLM